MHKLPVCRTTPARCCALNTRPDIHAIEVKVNAGLRISELLQDGSLPILTCC